MDSSKLVSSLERFGRLLPAVVIDVASEVACWKPPDGAWSILEVVCHLADEEELDFRRRLNLTLSNSETTWPAIAPEAMAIERRYNDGELAESVVRFAALRAQSVTWLRSLVEPNWNRAHQHPEHGPIRAGDLLASWAAHDYLHLRQISKRLYQLAARDAGEFSVRYAGTWHA